jgi:glycosyltransferase involved in cell wall biosynthesis
LKSKIHVHYHGINFQELPFGFNSRSFGKIVAVGRFVKHKGFDYVLKAAQLLKSRQVPITVELVGDGEEAEALRSLASTLGIDSVVKFSGWLAADRVPAVIREASVLVHPSPEIGDGVPNVIKEAMAVGTPVIGSMVAGIPELLGGGKYGMLVPAQDSNALADGIQSMLLSEQLRQNYAKAARNFAEKQFDVWQNGRRLAEALERTSRDER